VRTKNMAKTVLLPVSLFCLTFSPPLAGFLLPVIIGI
jgi:hypothetical protein